MGAKLMRVELKLDVRGLASRAETARTRALERVGEDILERSKRIAPLRTGKLVNSARAQVAGSEVRVSYSAPYALLQHEDTRLRHPNGGQAKYLSRALEDPATLQRVAEAYAEALRG